jgi:putative spermidine/putrescine transport system permease protein
LAAALALHRGRFPGRSVLGAAFLTPLVFPGILLGIALLYSFGAIGLRASFLTLFLGHMVVALPYTIRLILGALPSVARDIEEAAATLGAGQMKVLRTVTLPLITPALAAGFLFAFLASFDNVIISVFLAGNRTVTLPVRIFSYIEFSTDASVAAISTIFIAITLGLMTVLYKTGRFNAMEVGS